MAKFKYMGFKVETFKLTNDYNVSQEYMARIITPNGRKSVYKDYAHNMEEFVGTLKKN